MGRSADPRTKRGRRIALGLVAALGIALALLSLLGSEKFSGRTARGIALTPFVPIVGHSTVSYRWRVDCRECHGDPKFAAKTRLLR